MTRPPRDREAAPATAGEADAPSLAAIVRARARIRDLIVSARLLASDPWAGRDAPAGDGGAVPARFVLVDDTVQATGAFKLRGAAAALTALADPDRGRGVVAVSTGNHGRAVAYAAGRLGMRATVFVSRRVPRGKLDALLEAGADVRVGGEGQDEAEERARAFASETGAAWVPPFDDPHVIAGQGTLGLELLDALPDLSAVVIPLSGGGLAAGVATAVRAVRPEVRVFGVGPERGAAMIEALRAGRSVPVPEAATLADSLQGGLGRDNRYTLEAVRRLLHATVRASDADLADAMRFAFDRHRLVLEGGGAAAIAAVRSGRIRPEALGGGAVALLATGSSVERHAYAHVLAGGDGPPPDGDAQEGAG